jgi:hypothetical protein
VTFDRRSLGILALLVDLAGALALASTHDDLGAIRLGGVSLYWWYGLVAGPVFAGAVAGASLLVPARR